MVGAYDATTDRVVGRAHYSAEGRLMAFDTDPNTLWDSDITNVDCQEIGSYIAGADPFVCDSPGGVSFAFNSMWRSPVTGLVYMRNRVYSPRLGQFLSHDPLGYVDSFNMYQFASFDPINKWDPQGQNAIALGFAIAIGSIGVSALLDDTPKYTPDDPEYKTGVVFPSFLQPDDLLPGKAAAATGVKLAATGGLALFAAKLKKDLAGHGVEATDEVAIAFWKRHGDLGDKTTDEVKKLLKQTEDELTEAAKTSAKLADELGGGVKKAADDAGETTAKVTDDGAEAATQSADRSLKKKDIRQRDKERDLERRGGIEPKDGSPKTNTAQNRVFKDIANELNLTKPQREQLHRAITKQNLDYQEIRQIALDLFKND